MYQALYRKYRPQTFDDVIGQLAITQTLKTQITSNKTSHAYLFTGTRGTGKTTCSKILAKAVNCLNPENGNPCNRCSACRSIDEGSCMDVLEIDAASNNGVDNIRDAHRIPQPRRYGTNPGTGISRGDAAPVTSLPPKSLVGQASVQSCLSRPIAGKDLHRNRHIPMSEHRSVLCDGMRVENRFIRVDHGSYTILSDLRPA